jgi:hypothetical protein
MNTLGYRNEFIKKLLCLVFVLLCAPNSVIAVTLEGVNRDYGSEQVTYQAAQNNKQQPTIIYVQQVQQVQQVQARQMPCACCIGVYACCSVFNSICFWIQCLLLCGRRI